MRRQPSLSTRLGNSAMIVTVTVLVGCGGSASETPFPQPPIDRELAARHEHAWEAEEGDVDSSNATGATAASLASSDVRSEQAPPAPVGETPAEANEPPTNTPGVGF